VFLSQHYGGQQPVFYLLDKTEIERSVYYGLRSRGAFYNSLDVAKEMLVSNGVSEKCVQLIEATATNEIDIDREVDLVISLISWGFHYPVEAYLERVYDILAEGGSIIMDVRKGADGLGMLENALSKVNVIADHGKFQRVLAIK
jgi:SAM-dependent methyltransferase